MVVIPKTSAGTGAHKSNTQHRVLMLFWSGVEAGECIDTRVSGVPRNGMPPNYTLNLSRPGFGPGLKPLV
jgi:hypothetical protein